jgi:hypothetical protein
MPLNTKLAQLELLYMGHKLFQTNKHTRKQDELNHITTTLKCNGYPNKIIKKTLKDLFDCAANKRA